MARRRRFLKRQEALEWLSSAEAASGSAKGIGLALAGQHANGGRPDLNADKAVSHTRSPRGEDTMCRSMIMLGAIVTLVVGGAPRADAAPQSQGFAFGLRAGYGLPQGLLEGGDGHRDVPMKEIVKGIIPAQVDVGYFLGSRIYVGASFQYARGLMAEPCFWGASCSVSGLRFGANGCSR